MTPASPPCRAPSDPTPSRLQLNFPQTARHAFLKIPGERSTVAVASVTPADATSVAPSECFQTSARQDRWRRVNEGQ